MTGGSASIESIEVLRRFRARFLRFAELSRVALSGTQSDIASTVEWLKGDHLLHWKHELRRRENAVVRAMNDLQRVRLTASVKGGDSCFEERRALERARQSKEEADQKIRTIKKWSALLEPTVDKMKGPCQSLAGLLDVTMPRALGRLDGMMDRLDEYFRTPPPDAGGASPGKA